VRQGASEVVATGEPLELLLWLYGRGEHADVSFEGASDDVAGVQAAHLSI
jgi:hypothetical protein